jgi:hypothetical protein
MMQQRRVAMHHAERMADEHIPAWRHMAVVTKQMHHWAEKPTGGEMDALVDAYAAQYTQNQLESDAMPRASSESATGATSEQEFDASQSHPSTLGASQTESYPVETIGAKPAAAALATEMQSMFQKFKLDRESIAAPQSDADASIDPTPAQATGAKMRTHHSHSPYKSARTQGLFSSGHVRESDSITELQLTILNLENRLDVIRASAAFDPKHPDVVQAQLLVKQTEMP